MFFKLLIFIFSTVNAKTQPLKQSPLGCSARGTGAGFAGRSRSRPRTGRATRQRAHVSACARVRVKPGEDAPAETRLLCPCVSCAHESRVGPWGADPPCRPLGPAPLSDRHSRVRSPGRSPGATRQRVEGRGCRAAMGRPAAGPLSPALFWGMAEGRAVLPTRAPLQPLSRGRVNLSPVVWPELEVI